MSTRAVVLDEDGIEHLKALIAYNWTDERDDFEEHDGEKDCHIFVSIVALDNLVNGTDYKPEDHFRQAPIPWRPA